MKAVLRAKVLACCPRATTPKTDMNTIMTLLLGALLVAGAGGCVTSSGTKIASPQLDQIKKGVTTRAEVEKLFGAPTSVITGADGRKTLFYSYQATKESAGMGLSRIFGYVPFVAPGAATTGTIVGAQAASDTAGVKVQTQSLSITLSKDDIVEDFTFSEGSSDSGSPKLLRGGPR